MTDHDRAAEELLTERLSLRRPVPADIDSIFAIHTDQRTLVHNPSDALADRDAAAALFRRWDEHWRRFSFGYWVVRRQAAETPLGFCGLKVMRFNNEDVANLFYRFDPAAWGDGVATEAASAVTSWAAEHIAGRQLIARIRPQNLASQHVARHAGLERAEHLDSPGEDGLDWIYLPVRPAAQRDWAEWHRDYDDPGSFLSRRLAIVQGHLRAELDRAPAGDVRLISLCAGQGHDVIGVLAGHPRREDVRARLVELDERNVAAARQAAQAAGLDGVEVLQADAGTTDACAGAVPAQIVVACGIFGNITASDIRATVAAMPSMCAPGALVLWTRHRGSPDLTPAIRSWFGEAGFREEAFHLSRDSFMSVGAHRLTGEPVALVPGQRLFTFVART